MVRELITMAEEKVILERMRSALIANPAGLNCTEMMAAVEGLTINRCRRLLTVMIGRKFATRSFEVRPAQSNGQARKFLVYRARETP